MTSEKNQTDVDSSRRFRRLRRSSTIRALVRETQVSRDDLMLPLFVQEGLKGKTPVPSMPGVFRYGVEELERFVETFVNKGGRSVLLFGLPKHKDAAASSSADPQGVVPEAVRRLKKAFPDLVIATDVCLCAYMDHGHCGLIHEGRVDNDKTLPLLGRMALAHAAAGADMVAPSDMMDFRVKRIRQDLDDAGFEETLIMSYSVKYASQFYGPFRDAADSAPQFGDRKTYQMDPANRREAVKEALRDVEEGADIVMVKPALAYLDVISSVREAVDQPLAAYSVSGEYSLIKAAAGKNWVDEQGVVWETLTAIKRAGADILISYHADDVLKWMSEENR